MYDLQIPNGISQSRAALKSHMIGGVYLYVINATEQAQKRSTEAMSENGGRATG